MAQRHAQHSQGSLKLDRSANLQRWFDFDPSVAAPVLALLSPDDIYADAATYVQTLKEDRRIERKPATIHQNSLAEYLSCWANTSPHGGIVVVGMEDNGEVSGCRLIDQNRLNDIEKVGIDFCPDAVYETKRIPATNRTGDADFLLLFRVKYHDTRVVETSNRRVFQRRGDSKYELKTDAERQQLRIDKGEVQFEQELVSLQFPDDFDMRAVVDFADRVRAVKALQYDPSDTKVLELMHLGRRIGDRFMPNIACTLLFAKDPTPLFPGCRVRFLKFEGESLHTGDKWNATRDETIEGTVPQQIETAIRTIGSQVRTISVLDKHGKFSVEPEYPRDAWLEALVNACAHRSYHYRNANIFVRMYDDRLVIESPGPFPPGVTKDTIYDIQHSRNPFLMEALRYLDLVKAANEGVARIRNTMLALRLPEPEFSQAEEGMAKVTVTLRNDIKSRRPWVDTDVVAALGAALTKQLSAQQRLVMNFVVIHGRVNVSDVSRLTEHNWKTSRKLLDKLADRGILRYVHREDMAIDRQAHWVLALGK